VRVKLDEEAYDADELGIDQEDDDEC